MGLPALDQLAWLRKPSPLSPRRWSPEHKTRPGVKSRGRHERASQELEAPPQMGRRNHKALPPEGERECSIMAQGTLNEGTCEPSWPSQEPLHEVVQSTWEGPGPWDPGGGPTGEQILNPKRPVEAMDITAGIVAQKKNPSCAACAMSVEPPAKSQSRTWDPYSIVPIYRPCLAVDVATDFHFEAHAEGTTSPWEMQKQRRKASTRHQKLHRMADTEDRK